MAEIKKDKVLSELYESYAIPKLIDRFQGDLNELKDEVKGYIKVEEVSNFATKSGWYYIRNSVIKPGNGYYQMAINMANGRDVWIRTCNNNLWTNWHRVILDIGG